MTFGSIGLEQLLQFTEAAGILGLLAVAAKHYVDRRRLDINTRDSDAAIRDGEWKRIVEWNHQLQEECKACHQREADAKAEAIMWQARALMAEAASEGIGLVRTAQAISDAEKRQRRRDEGDGNGSQNKSE